VNELLVVLDRKVSLSQRLRLFGTFTVGVLALLALGELIGLLTGSQLLVHVLAWLGWFAWQSWLFRESHQRAASGRADQAYRQAFYRHIVPGVSFGVSQMLRPAWHGLLEAGPAVAPLWQLAAGLGCLALGLDLLRRGFETLGLARAGFLAEYGAAAPRLIRSGVFSCVRHPLFLGGVVGSIGASLLVVSAEGLALALVNLLMLPIYERIEDGRLIQTFGDEYADYREQVGGIVPKPGAFPLIVSGYGQSLAALASAGRAAASS
jgi:protein-S-isoprenylcysteine O-methyltransferase Ste14